MPSRTSKRTRTRATSQSASPWKAESGCSEPRLGAIARELASQLRTGDRVLLEGPLGAGKTTFSRALLEGLGVVQPPSGSPTFAIAHEYASARGEVIHVDVYRIRSEAEIAEAGIEAYLWERQAIVIMEWASLWPAFEAAILRQPADRSRTWRVDLAFHESQESLRDLRISLL